MVDGGGGQLESQGHEICGPVFASPLGDRVGEGRGGGGRGEGGGPGHSICGRRVKFKWGRGGQRRCPAQWYV